MKNTLLKSALLATGTLLAGTNSHAVVTVFSETFDPAPETLTDFNMQLGGNPDLKPNNTKIFALDQWGLTSNGSIVDIGGDNGNVLQPQLDEKNNGRMAGIFIDPAHFASTGAGTYRLSMDVIPGVSTEGPGRVYVGAGFGYDLTGATDAKLNLAIAANGFGVNRTSGEIVWPALTASGGATAEHLITTTTEWILGDGTPTGQFRETPGVPFDAQTAGQVSVEFEYDGVSAVVVAVGGYNTDVKIDNIMIESLSGGNGDTWAGWPIEQGRYVDTGSFLGYIEISADPWQWCYNLGKYIWLPEYQVNNSGGWIYVGR
jgi:hypothetical protein